MDREPRATGIGDQEPRATGTGDQELGEGTGDREHRAHWLHEEKQAAICFLNTGDSPLTNLN